jgi:hypothetical protein
MNKYNRDKLLYFNRNVVKYIPIVSEKKEQEFNLPKLVSSRGILHKCSIKSPAPVSSIQKLIGYNFSLITEKSIVYICTSAINEFIKILPTIKNKFILVTGDADEDPNIYDTSFIDNPLIIHWFAQNSTKIHQKITIIPIGLDYHTLANCQKNHSWGPQMSCLMQEELLLNIKSNSKPFFERLILGYANFQFSLNGRYCYDRVDAIKNINKNLIYYEQNKLNREESWKKQSEYAFVVSPHGNGLDCHRTWEALCLGCIPIVKTSGIDRLFNNLPVLIVKDWKDLTPELLNKTVEEFKSKPFQIEKLTLEYWINLMNNS